MSRKSTAHFDERHLLHVLKHYLPTQGPLKDFIHHNTLHAFQGMKFYDAIHKASTMFGYQTTFSLAEYRDLYKIGRITPDALEMVIKQNGDRTAKKWRSLLLDTDYDEDIEPRVGRLRCEWAAHYPIDLDNAVQPLLFRIMCSYIDQGIAVTPFPYEDKGLLNAIRSLEKHSLASFFTTKKAKDLLFSKSCTMTDLLEMLVGKEYEAYYEQYIYDQQFGHRGWSGIVATLEDKPEALLYSKNVSLEDMIILELLLEIDALTSRLGNDWKPLGENVTESPPLDLLSDAPTTELQEVLRLWQDAFEWGYYDTVLAGISQTMPAAPATKKPTKKSFQAVFCIDDREYSLRTHVERLDENCETLGSPGFFGVEFYFQPAHAQFYDKLCPAPVNPKFLIKEISNGEEIKHKKEIMYTKHSHRLMRGFLASYILGIPALGKLIANLINPTMSPAIADAFSHMNPAAELTVVYDGEHDKAKGLQIGFTTEEMTDRVEKVLRCIGLTDNFSSVVYIMGHGSSSANNPHHGAHDCGACNGRPGLVNARVFAHMANYQPVRELLAKRGLSVPETTQFVGALHDTASDEIMFYDEHVLTSANQQLHHDNKQVFEDALDLNAKERSRRFVSIGTKQSIKKIRSDIKKRSVSYFEPRPELGHGTNALCVVGSRELTKNLFLDRRAFLNSYDYSSDPDGTLLYNVIAPLAGVCGGINLEYFFSRMDNYKLGAGTKLPHNVMGLIGVANSSDGDLRSGLPLQMVEVHDPVRLMMIVEHRPDVIEKTIRSDPGLYEWFSNEWIHLVALNPKDKKQYVFKDGTFVKYHTFTQNLSVIDDLPTRFETAKKMRTNHLLDATLENLPVQIIK